MLDFMDDMRKQMDDMKKQNDEMKKQSDEMRKLKAIIVKHENRIRALEAELKARSDDVLDAILSAAPSDKEVPPAKVIDAEPVSVSLAPDEV